MISQLLPVSALLLSTFFMLAGVGLGGVLVPLRASLEGWSATDIAWIGTSYAVAFTAACILVPHLVRRVGHIRVFAVLQTLLVVAYLLHALIVSPIAWAFIRALGGFALAGGYMVVESWLNEKVSNKNRGAIFSAYMIVSMTAVAVGQYIMPFGDAGGNELFMIIAILFALALLPTALTAAPAPVPLTQVSLDLKGLFRKSPVALVGSVLAGVIAGNWLFFAPLYGETVGLSSLGIATMMAAAMVGGAVFQFPLGALSDRIDRRHVMVMAGLIGMTISLLMAFAQPVTPLIIFAGMFLFGSVLFPIYALNVAHANDQAEPEEFVKVSSGLLIVYGIGTMAGPQFGGRLMEAFGAPGFFGAMAISFAIYGSYAWWRSMRRTAIRPEDRADFRILPLAPAHTPETLQMDPRSEDVPEEERQRDEEPKSLWGYEFN